MSLAWAQYCSGIRVSILEDTTTRLPLLESENLSSMRNYFYLASVGESLELKWDFVVTKQHAQDIFLMDVAMESQCFKPKQSKQVNYWRMYLNVLMLSNITTAKGDYINPLMFLEKLN